MLTLNEDQKLLMDSARAAVAERAPVSEYRQLREPQGEGFSRDFWALCGEMGWSGVLVPEAQGGAAFGVVGAGLVAREMARTLAPSPFLSTAVLAATALGRGRLAGAAGSVAAAHRRARRRSSRFARRRAAPALDDAQREGAGFPARRREAFRARRPRRRRVPGRGDVGDAPALFLVAADAPGVTRQTRILVDGRRVASVELRRSACEGAQLPGRARLSSARSTSAAPCSRPRSAASPRRRFARTLDYLKERRQFDRRIGSFQALQHRAALAHIAVENAWSATLQALQSLDARAPSRRFRRRGGQVEGEPHGRRGDGGMPANARRHRHDRRVRHRPLSQARAGRRDLVRRCGVPRRPCRDDAGLLKERR